MRLADGRLLNHLSASLFMVWEKNGLFFTTTSSTKSNRFPAKSTIFSHRITKSRKRICQENAKFHSVTGDEKYRCSLSTWVIKTYFSKPQKVFTNIKNMQRQL